MRPTCAPVTGPTGAARLGIDPGGIGGALLRRQGRPERWWCWSACAAGWRLRTGLPDQPAEHEQIVRTMGGIGRAIGQQAGPCAVVLEGLFAKNAASLVLAERAGSLLDGLRDAGCPIGKVERPLAVDRRRGHAGWRRAILGLPDSMGAAAAEDRAIEVARREGWLPRGLTMGEQGAVAEAGAMSRWEAA